LEKIIGILSAVLTIALLAVQVIAADIQASVTVPPTCGFTYSGNLNFASTTAGTSSDIKTLTLTNTGSQSITIQVNGTDWTYSTYTMSVGQTKHGITSPPTTSLTTTPATLTSIGNLPSNTKDTYFQMSVPSGQTTGNYQQTITLTGSC
jgi:hypothetical protein